MKKGLIAKVAKVHADGSADVVFVDREEDDRFVYGVGCTFMGPIGTVGHTPSGLPCCPHCGSVLFETTTQQWNEGIDEYCNKTGDYDYRKFILWMMDQKKCRPIKDLALARKEFDALEL